MQEIPSSIPSRENCKKFVEVTTGEVLYSVNGELYY